MFDIATGHVTKRWRTARVALLLFALSGILVACGGRASTNTLSTQVVGPLPVASITITATDSTLNMPVRVPAGLVDITLVNAGTRPHQAILARMREGILFSEFQNALMLNERTAYPLIIFVGGANTIMPGKSQEVLLILAPGQYVALGSVSGQSHVPYTASRLVKPFTVIVRDNWDRVSTPASNGEVILKDFAFNLPSTIPSGAITLKVTNNGAYPHEMLIARLTAGKTMHDVEMYTRQQAPLSPPPFGPLGGMGALSPASWGWVKLNLTPGTYVALCYMLNTATGKPFVMQEMYKSFSVQ